MEAEETNWIYNQSEKWRMWSRQSDSQTRTNKKSKMVCSEVGTQDNGYWWFFYFLRQNHHVKKKKYKYNHCTVDIGSVCSVPVQNKCPEDTNQSLTFASTPSPRASVPWAATFSQVTMSAWMGSTPSSLGKARPMCSAARLSTAGLLSCLK